MGAAKETTVTIDPISVANGFQEQWFLVPSRAGCPRGSWGFSPPSLAANQAACSFHLRYFALQATTQWLEFSPHLPDL